jgi:subtilase family serine protease
VRDTPDISLFASNAFWQHAILFCMSDAAQGGVPCNYTNPTDTLENSAGGTSFTAPQLASIQALIDQKAGGPQGNPAPIYYSLAKTEFGTSSTPKSSALAACNASNGNGISSSCSFHDITVGNNAVPCYGKVNCYGSSAVDYGVLSTSDNYFNEAYGSKVGWDFTTGLGTINVTNVVNRWP